MPDLKETVRQMAAKGMSEAEIKSNLRELGVEDVDSVYAEATKPQPAQAQAPEGGAASIARLAQEGLADSSGLEKKLDDLSAQLKVLTDLNQKILDANRQILLRLKQ